MKRLAYLLFASLALSTVFLFPASPVTYSQRSSATVRVDCTRGQSINEAMTKKPKAYSLIVEISGMCRENVVVTRDRVTLRGTDPAGDGIQAEENTDLTDPTLWVRGAGLVNVENLTLTGGFSGLLATNANLPLIQVTNSRLVGNSNFGIQLENSLVNATDTTFEGPVNSVPAGIFMASRLGCLRCTFTSPGPSPVMIVINGVAVIGQQSSLTGGSLRAEGSSINISDSTISSPVPGIPVLNATSNNSVILTRVEVLGRMLFGQGTNAGLFGVVQTGIGNQPNEASFGSNVILSSTSPATGGPPTIHSTIAKFNLTNFANLVLNPGSVLDGDLICRAGSNAHCAIPADVTGVTNCGLCPKP